MIRRIAVTLALAFSVTSLFALTSKRNPGASQGNPPCNPDAGEKISEVAGARSCFCLGSPTGHVEFSPIYPKWIFGSLYNTRVHISCAPEQEASEQNTCTYRSDCSSDYDLSLPGWFYYWPDNDKPIFTVEAGPGTWP